MPATNSRTKPSGSQGESANAITPPPSSESVIAIRLREPATRPATKSAAVTAPAPKAPMMKPATVSFRSKACAKAGASVLTGSEANPTAATTIRKARRRGSSRSRPSASRRREVPRSAVSCGRGRIARRAPTKTRYENEFSRNEAGMPRYSTDAAPSAGPIARARLYVIELSATAVGRLSRSTREAINACWGGIEIALVTPSPRAKTITTHAAARPDQARMASVAASSEPVDEQCRSEVLEPGPARGKRVACEVRAEVPLPDQSENGGRAGGRTHGELSIRFPSGHAVARPRAHPARDRIDRERRDSVAPGSRGDRGRPPRAPVLGPGAGAQPARARNRRRRLPRHGRDRGRHAPSRKPCPGRVAPAGSRRACPDSRPLGPADVRRRRQLSRAAQL